MFCSGQQTTQPISKLNDDVHPCAFPAPANSAKLEAEQHLVTVLFLTALEYGCAWQTLLLLQTMYIGSSIPRYSFRCFFFLFPKPCDNWKCVKSGPKLVIDYTDSSAMTIASLWSLKLLVIKHSFLWLWSHLAAPWTVSVCEVLALRQICVCNYVGKELTWLVCKLLYRLSASTPCTCML